MILSGGPASVPEPGSPRAPWRSSRAGCRFWAICYGEQTLCEQLGGKVESGHAARIRPRGGRNPCSLRPVRRRLANGWPLARVDEPRRSRDPPARGLPRLCGVGEPPYAVIADEARRYYTTAVPSRGGSYARRREAYRQFPAQDRRPQGRLDDGRFPRGGDRPHPRSSWAVAGDLRPLGRRRFGGCGGADSRGDRRPADLRVRRSRADAARTRRTRS